MEKNTRRRNREKREERQREQLRIHQQQQQQQQQNLPPQQSLSQLLTGQQPFTLPFQSPHIHQQQNLLYQ